MGPPAKGVPWVTVSVSTEMTTPVPSGQAPKSGIPKLWIALAGCGGILVLFVAVAVIVGLLVWSSNRDGAEDSDEPEVEASASRDGASANDPQPASSPERPSSSQSFAIGDRVEIEASNHWVPCVVSENQPPSVMRVQCEEYPSLSRGAGAYTVDRDNPSAVRHATGETGPIPAPPPPPRQVAGPAGLKVGEYACYGSGGRLMIGLGFKVLSPDRYEDLDGGNAGSFSVSGTTVTFRGGHLDGQTGRNLRGHTFTIARQADCEPY